MPVVTPADGVEQPLGTVVVQHEVAVRPTHVSRAASGLETGISPRGASGYVLPIPDVGERGAADADTNEETDPLTTMRRDLQAAAGKTVLAPTTMAGWGGGSGVAPSHDWQPRRFVLHPPPATVELRRDVTRDIAACYGIPSVMFDHAAPGGSLREAWRAALALSIAPVVELVTGELRRALDVPDLQLDMKRARAADVTMLSRAASSLASIEGVDFAQARAIVGL